MANYTEIKSKDTYVIFFNDIIKESDQFSKRYELVSNLSYNMQYLEYLNLRLKEDLHSTIKMEFIKTFVITGMSIVESILYYLIRSHGYHKEVKFKEIERFQSNIKKQGSSKTKVETIIWSELKYPEEAEMTLDSMLKKVEKKKLIGNEPQVYKDLNYLRRLRNKIHLYVIEKSLDTDWNNFGENELELIKKSLRAIINASVFSQKKNEKERIFDFLKQKPLH